MSTIPHKFNRLGLSKGSSFDLEKGLLFHAPLQENFDCIGGVCTKSKTVVFDQRNGKKGFTFNNTPFTYSDGVVYTLSNFPSGSVDPFTISLWYNGAVSDYKGTSGDNYNMALFYLGIKSKDKQIGYEMGVGSQKAQPGWAWSPNNYSAIYKDNFEIDIDGEWHCFITAFENGVVSNFYDGVLIGQHTTPTLNITNKQLYIGSRVEDRRYWYGLLTCFTIHDYCFTEADAKGFMDYTK